MSGEKRGKLHEINDEMAPLIEKLKDEKIVSIDEDTFRHKLLPLAVARFSNVDYELEHTNWQAITGQKPFFGVRVMRGGEELFVTPPLILSPEITFEGSSLLDQLNTAERNEKNGLPKGDVMDQEVLKPTLGVRNLNDSMNLWLLIFSYYGIKLDIVDEDGNVVTPPEDNVAETSSVEDTPKKPAQAVWEDDDDGEVL